LGHKISRLLLAKAAGSPLPSEPLSFGENPPDNLNAATAL
jgi:hypothetical protein